MCFIFVQKYAVCMIDANVKTTAAIQTEENTKPVRW